MIAINIPVKIMWIEENKVSSVALLLLQVFLLWVFEKKLMHSMNTLRFLN